MNAELMTSWKKTYDLVQKVQQLSQQIEAAASEALSQAIVIHDEIDDIESQITSGKAESIRDDQEFIRLMQELGLEIQKKESTVRTIAEKAKAVYAYIEAVREKDIKELKHALWCAEVNLVSRYEHNAELTKRAEKAEAELKAIAERQAPEEWRIALKEAVAALYFDDSSDYKTALYAVVRHLSPPISALIESEDRADHSRAYHQTTGFFEEQPDGTVTPVDPADLEVILSPAQQAPAQHHDDFAVDLFATAMKDKMAASRAKGRGGWDKPDECDVEDLAAMLVQHVEKGDPVDIANFCMMIWNRVRETGPDTYAPIVEALAAYSGKEAASATDAARYQRLRVLGAAPYGAPQLEQGTVLRFTSLDDFVDRDIASHPSRGEFTATPAQATPEGGLLKQFLKAAEDAGITHLRFPEATPEGGQDERAAFEAWFSENVYSNTSYLNRRNDDQNTYVSDVTEARWIGWQARAALAASRQAGKPLLFDAATEDEATHRWENPRTGQQLLIQPGWGIFVGPVDAALAKGGA